MRVLVTGGAGFIGSHIVDLLLKENHEVAVIDNLVHGKVENIDKRAKFFEVDITTDKVNEVFSNFKPEVVIHHAAQIKVPKSIEDPIYDANVNVIGLLNILEACVKNGVRKIIYPASAAMFAKTEYLPIDEKHPIAFMSQYGVTKQVAEHYMQVYSSLYDLKYTVFRYANVYGPRQDSSGEGGVVSIFCETMLKNNTPKIFGDGLHTRDYVFVKDVARANLLALNNLDNEICNVATCKEISVREVFDTIAKETNFKNEPEYVEERKGDIRFSYMSYDKINKLVGFKPEYDFKHGIEETVKFYKESN